MKMHECECEDKDFLLDDEDNDVVRFMDDHMRFWCEARSSWRGDYSFMVSAPGMDCKGSFRFPCYERFVEFCDFMNEVCEHF